MNRLLTLGLLVSSAGGASAGDPVPALPPASGSLSQSLPSVVNGGLSVSPPPVMVSQPTWGVPAALPCVTGPTVRPVPIPQYQVYPMTTAPCGTGCGSRGGLLDRLRAWLCGGPGPAYRMGIVFAPPVAPPRAWTSNQVEVLPANGAAGWPGRCEVDRGRRLPLRAAAGGCATGPCGPTVGPRPIGIPQFPMRGFQRPNLLNRLWDMCVPGGESFNGGCDTGTCATGECAAGAPLLGRLLPSLSPAPYYPAYSTYPTTGSTVSTVPAPAPTPLTVPTPVPAPQSVASLAGGYPYAVTPAPASPLVKVNTTPTVPPVPTATQPFTRQR